MPEPTKVDIINALGRRHGWTTYLEFCNANSGWKYGLIDRSIFSTTNRLMYMYYQGYDDGYPVEFHSDSFDITTCIQQVNRQRLRYDLIFLDPWHEYVTSYRDWGLAFDWLKPGGALVVHDCRPDKSVSTAPWYELGEWSGVTFEAYIDFVRARRSDLSYCTIDTDMGVGIIRRSTDSPTIRIAAPPVVRLKHLSATEDPVEQAWRESAGDHVRRLALFNQHARQLLRLRSYDEFVAELASGSSDR